MFRISTMKDEGHAIYLKVEGRIVKDWVSELEHICRSYLTERQRVSLDFSDVRYIDRHGVNVLKKILGEKVEIVHASLMVQALLER